MSIKTSCSRGVLLSNENDFKGAFAAKAAIPLAEIN
jgi:hypothetical protein